MKRILIIAIIGFVFSTVQAQVDNPLKEGTPNTVKLPSGEVIYDLNGEWDAIYDDGSTGKYEDILKISQKDKQFVGIYLLKGDYHLGKNKEKIKGKLKGNVMDEILLHDVDPVAFELFWAPCEGTISKDGNEMVIKREWEYKGAKYIRTLSLKRK
jgi:hypothetical protein